MPQLVELNRFRLLGLVLSYVLSGCFLAGLGTALCNDDASPLLWQQDYREAISAAQASKTFVLIWFFDPEEEDQNTKWEKAVLDQPETLERLRKVNLVKLRLSATVPSADGKGEPITLLKHAAFEEMLGKLGLAMIDMRDPKSPHFHHVVSVCPFDERP